MTIKRRQFVQLGLASAAALTLGTPSVFAAGKERTGSLSGRSGYKVKGTVSVSGDTVTLKSDYVFDPSKNPPDIKIGFGNGEKYAKGSKIHDKLTVKKGEASFKIPSGIDVSKYNELYIYCEKFTVILAVAPLS
ncbi:MULTISPECIES: DM13 domain-containing protein [Ruegeria]|uniref:DM13 domain-containing protein n=1 Tax=Ruegeria TaxID=97050 RepID=UPI00147F3280|nr:MULTISPECIES: DM13 domain-containing protein [Ruegeria]MBO9411924.1 DM13 domain-containing protein [Ruegeria sp. R8_1]MBO9417033.1 DM13 domain-containing protein [Ruegeria sp. R8_2]